MAEHTKFFISIITIFLCGRFALAQEVIAPERPEVPIGCILTVGCFDGEKVGGRTESLAGFEILSTIRQSKSLNANAYVANSGSTVATGNLLAKLSSLVPSVETMKIDEESAIDHERSSAEQVAKPPMEVNKEVQEFARSSIYSNCNDAIDVLTHIARAKNSTDGIKHYDELFDLGKVAYNKFIDYCSRQIPFVNKIVRQAAHHLVLFLTKAPNGEWYPFCVGFNYKDDLVLTAKHCLIHPTTLSAIEQNLHPGDDGTKFEINQIDSGFKFLVVGSTQGLLDAQLASYGRRQGALNYDVFNSEDDVAVIELKRQRANNSFKFESNVPSNWAKLLFFTPFINVHQLNEAIRSHDVSKMKEFTLRSIRMDDGAFCRVIQTRDNCIFHTCQSIAGFSGSPVFRIQANGIAIIGVHTGSLDPNRPACNFDRPRYIRNYGLALPNDLP